MLGGTPAVDALDRTVDIAALGASLGSFLATLHSVPVHVATDAGLGDADHSEDHAGQTAAFNDQLRRFGAGLPPRAIDRALALVASDPPPPRERLLHHGDFFPEHILMESAPCGVIDWGDVSFGDPAADLAGLYYWWGEPLLAAGLARYGAERQLDRGTIEDLAARARFIAVCRGGDDLEYGTRSGRMAYANMGARFLRML